MDSALVVPTIEYARLLHAQGKHRRANRILEQCWMHTRHPAAARAFVSIAGDDEPVAQLKSLQKLTSGGSDDVAGSYLLAAFALRADLWGEARRHLDVIFQEHPTAEAFEMMAELLEAEEGDLAAAEDWRAKAVSAVGPPVWACDKCGTTHDAWGAVCGSCNAFDSIHWTTPKQSPQPFQLTDESAVPLLTNSAK